jgi:hypothetical protein
VNPGRMASALVMQIEKDEGIRLRDEALLALLICAGQRVQEVCDVQMRNLDHAGGNVTIRYRKGGPEIGSDAECEPLMLGFASTSVWQLMHPQRERRLMQRVVEQCAHVAAARLRSDTQSVSSLERVSVMLDPAQRLSSGFVRTDPVERLTSTGWYITS